jgi:preprotein translocase subunit YajC
MMIWNSSDTLLAQAPAPAPGENLWTMVPFILVFVAMWVIMTGSQRKRAKQHEALVKSIKAGDKVTTSSGIIGTVVTVKERTVSIRSADTKLEVLKSAISEIIAEQAEPSQSPS